MAELQFDPAGRPLFPSRGAVIIDTFLSQPGFHALAKGDDDQRRAATKAIVEQLAFEFPDAGFTLKSASPTRPQSKDAIGVARDGRLFAWDWQNGETRERAVQPGQPAEDITGQNPLPTQAANHLGVNTLPSQPPPTPNTPPATDPDTALLVRRCSDRLDLVVELLGQIVTLLGQVRQTQDAQAVVLGNAAQNVSEALTIARGIHETTTHQAGEAERTSTNVHEAAVRVGEIANGLGPLISLISALRK